MENRQPSMAFSSLRPVVAALFSRHLPFFQRLSVPFEALDSSLPSEVEDVTVTQP